MKYQQLALIRILSSLILGVGAGIAAHFLHFSKPVAFEIGWTIFGLSYLIQGIVTFFQISTKSIPGHAKDEDLGIWLQFVLLVICCSSALFVLIYWGADASAQGLFYEILFIASVAFSWLILHLSFTFRYAHLYYGDFNEKYAKHARGLDFPDDDAPDYFDFAYYSFTIGMTFQVSDVVIKTKGLRRLTLIHSLVSFIFNTVLVALTINLLLR